MNRYAFHYQWNTMAETLTWTFSQMCILTASAVLGPLPAKEELLETLIDPNMEDIDDPDSIPLEIAEKSGSDVIDFDDTSAEEHQINDISIIASVKPAESTPSTTSSSDYSAYLHEFSIVCDDEDVLFDPPSPVAATQGNDKYTHNIYINIHSKIYFVLYIYT